MNLSCFHPVDVIKIENMTIQKEKIQKIESMKKEDENKKPKTLTQKIKSQLVEKKFPKVRLTQDVFDCLQRIRNSHSFKSYSELIQHLINIYNITEQK